MAEVQITGDLQSLVKGLSALVDLTPLKDPAYPALKASYVEASDLLEKSQGQAIEDAEAGYLEFTKAMREAMDIFAEAEKDIARITKAVKIASKVIGIAGKVIGKVC